MVFFLIIKKKSYDKELAHLSTVVSQSNCEPSNFVARLIVSVFEVASYVRFVTKYNYLTVN